MVLPFNVLALLFTVRFKNIIIPHRKTHGSAYSHRGVLLSLNWASQSVSQWQQQPRRCELITTTTTSFTFFYHSLVQLRLDFVHCKERKTEAKEHFANRWWRLNLSSIPIWRYSSTVPLAALPVAVLIKSSPLPVLTLLYSAARRSVGAGALDVARKQFYHCSCACGTIKIHSRNLLTFVRSFHGETTTHRFYFGPWRGFKIYTQLTGVRLRRRSELHRPPPGWMCNSVTDRDCSEPMGCGLGSYDQARPAANTDLIWAYGPPSPPSTADRLNVQLACRYTSAGCLAGGGRGAQGRALSANESFLEKSRFVLAHSVVSFWRCGGEGRELT